MMQQSLHACAAALLGIHGAALQHGDIHSSEPAELLVRGTTSRMICYVPLPLDVPEVVAHTRLHVRLTTSPLVRGSMLETVCV